MTLDAHISQKIRKNSDPDPITMNLNSPHSKYGGKMNHLLEGGTKNKNVTVNKS